jgi:hypothetical protein
MKQLLTDPPETLGQNPAPLQRVYHNSARSAVELNLGLRGEKPASNPLDCGSTIALYANASG